MVKSRLILAVMALAFGLTSIACSSSNGASSTQSVGLTLLPAARMVEAGFTLPLGLSDGGKVVALENVTFSSADESIATVDADGVVTGVAKGTVAITASYAGRTVIGAVQVTPRLVGLQVVPALADVAVELSRSMTVMALYEDHTTKDVTPDAVFSLHNPDVATVSGNAVTGVAAGSTRVAAMYHGRDAAAVITVSPRLLTGVSITSGPSALAQLTSGSLKATATFDDGKTLDVTKTASWSSSDDKILTVSNGALVPLKEGVATVTVNFAQGSTKFSATKDVAVKPNSVVVTAVEVSPASAAIPLDTETAFTATATFSDGSTQDVTDDVSWAIVNATDDTAKHGAVSAGLVSTTPSRTHPKPFAAGTAKVTATFVLDDGSKQEAEAALTVTEGTLTGVALTTAPLAVGGQTAFQAVATYSDPPGFTFDLTDRVAWWSLDDSATDDRVLTVDNSHSGVATGLAAGTATVQAWYEGNNVAETTVTVQ